MFCEVGKLKEVARALSVEVEIRNIDRRHSRQTGTRGSQYSVKASLEPGGANYVFCMDSPNDLNGLIRIRGQQNQDSPASGNKSWQAVEHSNTHHTSLVTSPRFSSPTTRSQLLRSPGDPRGQQITTNCSAYHRPASPAKASSLHAV